MITEEIKRYMEKNKLCSENLFHDWAAFLEFLFAQGGCVEAILWFEYVHVSQQETSLGAGGYRDENNPGYMYAETFIFQEGLEKKTREEVIAYIRSVIAAYPGHTLIPSFYLAD